ncbi:unnamed protein product [Urochloa humidicola]
MGRMSCFAGLLRGGKRKAIKGKNKGAYAKRVNGNDCPKVKPVDFLLDMADAVDVTTTRCDDVPACNSSTFVAHAAAGLARRGSAASGDKTAIKSPCSPVADLVVAGNGESGYGTGDGTGESAKSAEPDAGESSSSVDGRASSTPPKLQRSCSNIETTVRSPAPPRGFDDPLAKSRSYNDLNAVPPPARTDTPGGGYSSDTLDAVTVATAEASSPVDRVSAWVNSLGDGSSFFHAVEEDDATDHGGSGGTTARPQCCEIEEVPAAAGKRQRSPQAKRRVADEAAANQASSIVHTLGVFSSVAHISAMGLKAVPAIAGFSTLRAVNLSGNLIVQIAPGSLPKGLHSLDLSRNKIATIEGLRELTRLRVLNLSYNRISRIGHGLSGCTAIRELYLAGNKISDVEGLHRLLKLAVLDVSFNRVTTAKSLGQLVANYGSLRALNLLGNPVQAAAGDDALRRAVSGLLPRIDYLNKQAVKPQRAREVAKDSVAQAALGNGAAGGWSSRRRTARRVARSPGTPSKGRGRDGGSNRRGSRSRSKTRAHGTSVSISRR